MLKKIRVRVIGQCQRSVSYLCGCGLLTSTNWLLRLQEHNKQRHVFCVNRGTQLNFYSHIQILIWLNPRNHDSWNTLRMRDTRCRRFDTPHWLLGIFDPATSFYRVTNRVGWLHADKGYAVALNRTKTENSSLFYDFFLRRGYVYIKPAGILARILTLYFVVCIDWGNKPLLKSVEKNQYTFDD
jgi:hypothetical protein